MSNSPLWTIKTKWVTQLFSMFRPSFPPKSTKLLVDHTHTSACPPLSPRGGTTVWGSWLTIGPQWNQHGSWLVIVKWRDFWSTTGPTLTPCRLTKVVVGWHRIRLHTRATYEFVILNRPPRPIKFWKFIIICKTHVYNTCFASAFKMSKILNGCAVIRSIHKGAPLCNGGLLP